MSMPPSGIKFVMENVDDDVIIDAEIQQQLELIDLDNDDFNDDDNEVDDNYDENFNINDDLNINEAAVPGDVEAYFSLVQQQSKQLEEELKACDEVLYHTNSIELAPISDLLLEEEAKSRGLDAHELQKQILADLEREDKEEDEIIINDTDTNENQALVLADDFRNEKLEILKKLKLIEEEHQEKKLKWLQENESRKIEEEKQEEIKLESRQAFRLNLQQQENELNKLKESIQMRLDREGEQQQIELERNSKLFKEEMCELSEQLEREKNLLNEQIQVEQERQLHQQNRFAVTIQKVYRGYRVRREHSEPLKKMRIERKEQQTEERIKQWEKEIDKQKEEEKEIERKRSEEERKKEDEEAKKAAELKQIKEEKKKEELRKVEEIRKQEEEKKRKEEEQKEKLKLEKRQKEDRLKEEKRLEELRKKEEQKQQQEKQQQQEIEKQKAEEKLRELEEEKIKQEKDEEKKQQEEEAKLAAEEQRRKEDEELKNKEIKERIEKEKIQKEQEMKRLEEERKRNEEKQKKEAIERKKVEEEKIRQEKLKAEELKNEGISSELESLRLNWIKNCLPWSKISNEPWKLKAESSKRPPRRPMSAKKLPPLDDQIILSAARSQSLKQVTTVELHDLPGCSISTLGQCWGLQYLTMNKCHLVTVDGISSCKQLLYLDVQDNIIEFVDLKDLGKLQVVNMSRNKLSAIHGMEGCMNIRHLDVSYNKITRLGGLSPLRRLHTLLLNNNQIINTSGLTELSTLQTLNISHNHLQTIDAIQQLCLLQTLLAASNNIQQIPNLSNCVLLEELDLSDNSLTSLSYLSLLWLPLLQTVKLNQNSITDLPKFDNLLFIKAFHLNNNQILDPNTITTSLKKCRQLQELSINGNPAFDAVNNRDILSAVFPRLCKIDEQYVIPKDTTVFKPTCDVDSLCCYQAEVFTNLYQQFTTQLQRLNSKGPNNQLELCSCYFTYYDKSMHTAVEFRYAHEYGDTSLPAKPQQPKNMQPEFNPAKLAPSNPKDMFEKALQNTNRSSSNPKDLFQRSLQNSSESAPQPPAIVSSNPKDLFNKAVTNSSLMINSSTEVRNSVNSEAEATQIWMACIIIQSSWRGYCVRRNLIQDWSKLNVQRYPEELHVAATVIQSVWRGYKLRCRLFMALEYANQIQDEEDFDELPEFDMNDFQFDENNFDKDWRPSDTPQFPQRHAILGKPPSGKRSLPPIPSLDLDTSPPQPKHAWRNMDSPLSEIKGKQPRPPSSLYSGTISHRSHAESHLSKKSERLSEEWGFKDSRTAELMMQRAKKMKYNAQRKKKLGKLDPKQRLALFRKLEETAPLNPVLVPARKILPRKEYFQARVDEIERVDREKVFETRNKASRTYEWLHTQVGSHDISSPSPAPMRLSELKPGGFGSSGNLSKLEVEPRWRSLYSPDSASIHQRRHSIGDQQQHQQSYWGKPSVLPPIKTTSAPNCKLKEKMSWRRPDVEKSVGWGGGKKRTK